MLIGHQRRYRAECFCAVHRLMAKGIGTVQQRGRIKCPLLHACPAHLQVIRSRAAQRFATVMQQVIHLLLHIVALFAADQGPHPHLFQFRIAYRDATQPLQ
ncbi:hypothetical protein D3C71_1675360 [compost metagenome]